MDSVGSAFTLLNTAKFGEGIIKTLYHGCVQAFETVIHLLGHHFSFQMQNELGRLRIWADENNILRKSERSLDHRLRNSSHLRSVVVDLLQNIMDSLDSSTLPHTLFVEVKSSQTIKD